MGFEIKQKKYQRLFMQTVEYVCDWLLAIRLWLLIEGGLSATASGARSGGVLFIIV